MKEHPLFLCSGVVALPLSEARQHQLPGPPGGGSLVRNAIQTNRDPAYCSVGGLIPTAGINFSRISWL
jgi:hypothetical protein